ncbi:MAG: Rpn family recombination-promoting nuclease/putative transposase [Muribaculaceae bacterium]|nr:Rpn family recombination-promoting nuclease/putative transposase [Muribaculaceae bacterium]
MEENNKYVSFDWAMKHMLRDKANFDVLEGLLTVLIGEKITIVEILESEGNQDTEKDKFNRVDIKALNSKGHVIIVEVQLTRQLYFLERILYGTSKAITEHISLGDKYDKVKKVYSISILYCDFGTGDDYVYVGQTKFTGINTGTELVVKQKVRNEIIPILPEKVFPEYFLVKVNKFDKIPMNALDEWMEYLKTGRIKDDTTAPGLQAARKKLQYLKMSKEERDAYDRHIDNIMVQNDVLDNAKEEGREEGFIEGREEGLVQGREEGLVQGREEGRIQERVEIARNLLSIGMDIDSIAKATGLPPDYIQSL